MYVAAHDKLPKMPASTSSSMHAGTCFQGPAEEHDATWASNAIERGRLYAEAGADGLFFPGLTDSSLISKIAKDCPLPLNILAGTSTPSLSALAEIGGSTQLWRKSLR